MPRNSLSILFTKTGGSSRGVTINSFSFRGASEDADNDSRKTVTFGMRHRALRTAAIYVHKKRSKRLSAEEATSHHPQTLYVSSDNAALMHHFQQRKLRKRVCHYRNRASHAHFRSAALARMLIMIPERQSHSRCGTGHFGQPLSYVHKKRSKR